MFALDNPWMYLCITAFFLLYIVTTSVSKYMPRRSQYLKAMAESSIDCSQLSPTYELVVQTDNLNPTENYVMGLDGGLPDGTVALTRNALEGLVLELKPEIKKFQDLYVFFNQTDDDALVTMINMSLGFERNLIGFTPRGHINDKTPKSGTILMKRVTLGPRNALPSTTDAKTAFFTLQVIRQGEYQVLLKPEFFN